MKLVLRTTLILLAALLVVGGLIALRQTRVAQIMPGGAAFGVEGPPAGFEGHGAGRERPAGFATGRPEGFAGRGGHHDQGPSLLGLAEVGKNLGLIAAIVALIAAGGWLIQRGRRERPQPEQRTMP